MGKKKLYDCKLPIDSYQFSHANLSGVFMARGLGQVFDQAYPNFDLTLLTARNGQLASGNKYKMSMTADSTTFEPMTPLEPISNLSQFRVTFSAFEMLQRRSDLMDFSLEPVRAVLDCHDYFDGPSNYKNRMGLDPGVFCTQLVNMIRNDNAARWYKGEGFLTYNEIMGRFNSYQSRMSNSPDLFVKKNLDPMALVPTTKSDSSSSDKSSKKGQQKKTVSKYCHAYNSEKGCENKAYPFCYVNKEKKLHKCNVKVGKSYCTEFHTRWEHEKKD